MIFLFYFLLGSITVSLFLCAYNLSKISFFLLKLFAFSNYLEKLDKGGDRLE